MSGYPDDRFDRPPSPQEIEQARGAVAPPAVFLILNSLVGLVIVGLASVPFVFNPNLFVDTLKNMVAQQPPGPEKADAEQKLAQLEKEMEAKRDEFVRENAIKLGILLVTNSFVIVGAVAMRRLSSRLLCMTAAAIALVPGLTGCCITGMPFGLWALVVLNRADVKSAFAAPHSPHDPDAHYLR